MDSTAFFRAESGKCPRCGNFGVEQDEFQRCPSCSTMFNEYVVLETGMDVDLQNN